jgi:hypothetical protein
MRYMGFSSYFAAPFLLLISRLEVDWTGRSKKRPDNLVSKFVYCRLYFGKENSGGSDGSNIVDCIERWITFISLPKCSKYRELSYNLMAL